MSSQAGDIAAALAYQVKKEIAENYFGHRRELEEEREELLDQGKKIQKAWEQEVLAALRTIVALFPGPEKGRAFLALIGQEDSNRRAPGIVSPDIFRSPGGLPASPDLHFPGEIPGPDRPTVPPGRGEKQGCTGKTPHLAKKNQSP